MERLETLRTQAEDMAVIVTMQSLNAIIRSAQVTREEVQRDVASLIARMQFDWDQVAAASAGTTSEILGIQSEMSQLRQITDEIKAIIQRAMSELAPHQTNGSMLLETTINILEREFVKVKKLAIRALELAARVPVSQPVAGVAPNVAACEAAVAAAVEISAIGISGKPRREKYLNIRRQLEASLVIDETILAHKEQILKSALVWNCFTNSNIAISRGFQLLTATYEPISLLEAANEQRRDLLEFQAVPTRRSLGPIALVSPVPPSASATIAATQAVSAPAASLAAPPITTTPATTALVTTPPVIIPVTTSANVATPPPITFQQVWSYYTCDDCGCMTMAAKILLWILTVGLVVPGVALAVWGVWDNFCNREVVVCNN